MKDIFYIYGDFHDSQIDEIRIDYNNQIIEIYLDDVNFNSEGYPGYIAEPGILRFKGVKSFKIIVEEIVKYIGECTSSPERDLNRLDLKFWHGSEEFSILYEEFEMIPIGKDNFEFNPYEAE